MKVRLIRNLETERDKNQEITFEQMLNLDLYFDINNLISKIDGWKISNIKKLTKSLSDNSNRKIDIEFSKWNENIEFLFSNLNIELILTKKTGENLLKENFETCCIENVHNLLKKMKDDKNLKLEFLYEITRHFKNDGVDRLIIINEFINNGLSTIDVAIEIAISLWLFECGEVKK